MEPLPRGAQFIRAKMLWEIALHIAGDPNEPYYGNRDICITVGSGSGERYQPWLRMSVGSPILAHARSSSPRTTACARIGEPTDMRSHGW